MLYREIIAVCSQIHTKHINTVCGQNVELLNVKLVVHKHPVRTARHTQALLHAVCKYYFKPLNLSALLRTSPTVILSKHNSSEYSHQCL